MCYNKGVQFNNKPATNGRKKEDTIMTQAQMTETKRGRGRPASFPNQETKMAGFNLPTGTLEKLSKGAAKREITQNALLAKAIEAYCRKD